VVEFDEVAPLYDATRRQPSTVELDAVIEALGGPRVVLEAGVGTGRYSLPLTDRGFAMTGIDISTEMMRRAREKGLTRLLRADLHRLPFRDDAFEGALIVHVLQLIPDPFVALAELSRVARDRVVAVFPDRGPSALPNREAFRKRYRELAAERGYTLPEHVRYWDNGARLLRTVPPAASRHLEVESPFDPERERSWQHLRAFGGLTHVPEDIHRAIVEQIRAERGPRPASDRPPTRPLTIATWTAAQRAEILAQVGATGGRGDPSAGGSGPSSSTDPDRVPA
jgi:ubiquinone/menaquinone biosynthesis C-methylase UbiE